METETSKKPQGPVGVQDEKAQTEKRLQVMVSGVGHRVTVQPGSLTTDVLAQVGAVGKKLSKSQGPGKGLNPNDKVFEHVNDQDTLYVT